MGIKFAYKKAMLDQTTGYTGRASDKEQAQGDAYVPRGTGQGGQVDKLYL